MGVNVTLYMVCTIRDQIKFKGKSVNIHPESIKEPLSEDRMENTFLSLI